MSLQDILKRLTALEQANQPEKVPFINNEGTFVVNFTVNSRNKKYIPEKALAYYVVAGVPTLIEGYSVKVNAVAGVVTSIELDGLFGTGYVLLSN